MGLAPLARNDKELFTNTVVALSHCLKSRLRRCLDPRNSVENDQKPFEFNYLRTHIDSAHKMPGPAICLKTLFHRPQS